MADVNLVKSKYTDSDVTSLGELTASDNAKIPGTLQVVGATTLDTDLTVANGGTGASTLTDHGVLVGSGTDAVTALTAGTNGQVLVGSTGADPVFATITDGEGIDTTLGAGTLTIACEDASTSNKGVIEIATTAEDITGTSSSLASTPAGVAAAIATYKNPLAFAQGIYLTSSATVGGIVVADSAVYENTTNSFGHEFGVSLPDYTPSANVVIGQDTDGTNGWVLYVLTTGYLRLTINDTNFDSTATLASVGVTDGYPVAIGFSVTRSATLDSVLFAVNGYQLGNAVTSANEAGVTVANASDMYTMGTSTTRSAGRVYYSIPYNRAKTAAEHLAFFKNGIDYADKWGSQTAVYSTDFSVDTGWTLTNGAAIAGNVLTYATNASQGVAQRTLTPTPLLSQYIAITYEVTTNDSNTTLRIAGTSDYAGGAIISTSQNITSTVGVHTAYAKVTGVNARNILTLQTVAAVSTGSIVVDNLLIAYCGATLALEPEGIQPAPGQWLDSSANKLHAWQPATGSSLTRYKKTFEIRGVNTWAGTHEAQSVTMATDASRAMLPTDCYITEIIGVITGATIEDIIVGDGSDTDHWVAATTGLSTGTVSFTIANHTSDGTNMEMVVDPDANFTGSIEWTIRGFIID